VDNQGIVFRVPAVSVCFKTSRWGLGPTQSLFWVQRALF